MKFIFELLGVMVFSVTGVFIGMYALAFLSAWYLGTFTDW